LENLAGNSSLSLAAPAEKNSDVLSVNSELPISGSAEKLSEQAKSSLGVGVLVSETPKAAVTQNLSEQVADSQKDDGESLYGVVDRKSGEAVLTDGSASDSVARRTGFSDQAGTSSQFGDADSSGDPNGENARHQNPGGSLLSAQNSRPASSSFGAKPETALVGMQGASVEGEMTPVSLELDVALGSPEDASGSSTSATTFTSGGTVSGGAALNQLGEVSGARVEPPVRVNRAEVWDAVRESILRVASENPSHISVELRLDDGSTVGVELRMSSAGLQASFRSESNALLKTLESRWNGFLSGESPDLKVASAVFEGRSSFGGFSDSGRNGRELRQQMQDSADAAALGATRRSIASSTPSTGRLSSSALNSFRV
jgi:hypothetical protein